MAIQIFSVFFFLLVLMHNAGGSLHLDVNPYNISPGLTQSLTINCTFTYAQVSNISGLISLIISKMDQQETFQDLISINTFSPDQINVLSQVNGSLLGHISDNGESFLSIQWIYPSGQQAGMYRCEAHGMDNAGHASLLTQTANVTSDQLDMNQLIDKVSYLQRQLDRQENQTNYLTLQLNRQQDIERNQSQKIDYLTLQLNRQQDIERNQSQNIDYLNSQLDRQENIISHQSDLIDTLLSLTKNQSDIINKQQTQLNIIIEDRFGSDFRVSSIYHNHVYLLSNGDWNNSTVAEQTCKDYKGYLAEIDDSSEDTFVNTFLTSLTGFDAVLISGTDQDHEGVWTYTGSSRNMSYINWYSDEPDQPYNNCMFKYRGYHWQVRDYPCTHTYTNSRFLCEVNLQ